MKAFYLHVSSTTVGMISVRLCVTDVGVDECEMTDEWIMDLGVVDEKHCDIFFFANAFGLKLNDSFTFFTV